MKILAPVNNSKEVEPLIHAGANEFYCGIIPEDWMKKYGHVASINRREWKAANLMGFDELKNIVSIAHKSNVPVYLTLNALYSNEQYPMLYNQLEKLRGMQLDGLIVADLSLFLNLKERDLGFDIHISTGATLFNTDSIEFFKNLGATRMCMPRQLLIDEIKSLTQKYPEIEFEVLVMNSGCKYIDGYCTFQHGVKEAQDKNLWNLPKKLNADRHILDATRRLPKALGSKVKTGMYGVDSACLLDYKVTLSDSTFASDPEMKKAVTKKISSSYNLLSGADSCGGCRLFEFNEMGIEVVKIAGRNYTTAKKINDIQFIRTMQKHLDEGSFEKEEFYELTMKTFRQIYKFDCGKHCYYPFEEEPKKQKLKVG